MRLTRIFVNPQDISSEGVVFDRRNARYLRTVLRLRPGDLVVVFDGKREFLVRLKASQPREISGEIIGKMEPRQVRTLDMTLAFCLVRPDPVSQILRHGTELGVTRFVPLLSYRSARRPAEKKSRWDSIVASAAAQSTRVDVPTVEPPMAFGEFVGQGPGEGLGIVLSPYGLVPVLPELLTGEPPDSICLVVGPEGGLEADEERLATDRGFLAASLGPMVLRAETAAISAAGACCMWYHARAASRNRGEPTPEFPQWIGPVNGSVSGAKR